MRRLVLALTLGALLLATVAGMKNARSLSRNCQSISLRYEEPLETETVQQAKEKVPGLTFWTQEPATVTGGWNKAESQAIWYWGEPALVLGKECSYGQTPAPLDGNGCVLSTTLAYQLFGSLDVVGLTLSPAKGLEYTVRGVFESQDSLVLLPQREQAFTAVELPLDSKTREDPEAWVDAILLESQLPQPQWRLYTPTLASLGWALAWLPLVFGGGVLAVQMIRGLSSWNYPRRDGVLFLAMLLLALALPAWLESLPSWLIPSRWSDFSWWGDTAEKFRQQLEAFLLAPGMGRDLAIKAGALVQVGIALAQGVLCEVLRCGFAPGRKKNVAASWEGHPQWELAAVKVQPEQPVGVQPGCK